jgi:Small integral membrane protein
LTASPRCIAFTPGSLQKAAHGSPDVLPPRGRSSLQETRMLKWAIIFAIVSLITGWLGFGSVSGVTATIAKVLFACFVILFLLAVLAVIGVIHLL